MPGEGDTAAVVVEGTAEVAPARPPVVGRTRRARSPWLDRPVPGWACVLSWVVATAVFLGTMAALGGIAIGDMVSTESGALSFAHGQTTCAFPPDTHDEGPLYPLLAAGVLAVARPGASTPFPHGPAMAAPSAGTAVAVRQWMAHTHTVQSVAHVGVLVWCFLLSGLVLLLRAAGRGRRRAEVVGVLVLAVLPPVLACLHTFFHPEDLLALGFVLAAMAAFLRRRWFLAGVLVGLGITAQPFAALAAIPLVVLSPGRSWLRTALGAVLGVALLAVPLALFTYHGVGNAFLGAGTLLPEPATLVGYLHLSSGWLGLVSRGFPLVAAAALSLWARRRSGDGVPGPEQFVAVVTVALCLRLVSEVYFWGYYLAAAAVLLLVLDLVGGRLRTATVAFFILCGAFFPLVFEVGPVVDFGVAHLSAVQTLLTGWALVLAVGPLRPLGRRTGRPSADGATAPVT